MSFPSHLYDSVSEQSAEAKQKELELKKQAEDAAHVARVWQDLLDYMNREWPMHILHLFETEESLFRVFQREHRASVGYLEEIEQKAKEDAEDIRRRFPTLLDEQSRKAGLEINPESRHPRYYFEGKFLTLEINDQKRFARLSDHEGRLDEFPADVGAVVEVVIRERKRIFDRNFEGKIFLKKLRNQYLAILRKDKKEDGAGVPIRQITRRLGKNEKGFRTDEFLIDLSRLVQEGPVEIDGRRLDLQQTKDTSQGMLLHGTDIRGYIGFVTFRKVQS